MKRRGLTLIELLIAIGAITILTAVLTGALQGSRRRARAALCASNTRQLLFALFSYETENETFPHGFDNTPMSSPPGGYPGYIQYDRTGWWWFNRALGDRLKDSSKDSIIWCPSRQLDNRKLEGDVLCGNYGVNLSICKSTDDVPSRREEFVGTPLRSAQIPRPWATLLVVDSGYSIVSWRHATDVPPVSLGAGIEDSAYIPGLWINKVKDLWRGQEWDAIKGRHPNKTVNVGFADGHVSRMKADDLFVEKAGNGYENQNPLWVPK